LKNGKRKENGSRQQKESQTFQLKFQHGRTSTGVGNLASLGTVYNDIPASALANGHVNYGSAFLPIFDEL
jgi:hypothetical protein